jgi:hypothetical protein
LWRYGVAYACGRSWSWGGRGGGGYGDGGAQEECDKWIAFARRFRSLLGLGEGRGGGACLLNVVKKEFDLRDAKIKSLSARLVHLEDEAARVVQDSSTTHLLRMQAADKIEALEKYTGARGLVLLGL